MEIMTIIIKNRLPKEYPLRSYLVFRDTYFKSANVESPFLSKLKLLHHSLKHNLPTSEVDFSYLGFGSEVSKFSLGRKVTFLSVVSGNGR